MLAGLMPIDKKSTKTSDFDILTALKVLTELVKLEPGGYISISTESIEIKVILQFRVIEYTVGQLFRKRFSNPLHC